MSCDLVDKGTEEPADTCRDAAANTYLTVLKKEELITNIKIYRTPALPLHWGRRVQSGQLH